MNLVDDGFGSYQLKFFLREIEEHTFDVEQYHDSSLEAGSARNSDLSKEPLYRDRYQDHCV